MYRSEVNGKGGIRARVVADSISNGVRITTMEIRFHRFILPEFNTHRMFSRNFSSSRAIPVSKMIEQVTNDPAMPIHWGKNQSGMQASEECNSLVKFARYDRFLVDYEREEAWGIASYNARIVASSLSEAGYHKQIVNRLIEPFQFVNGVVTATEWDNFFALRDHRDAQPEIAELAKVMKQAMVESEPVELEAGGWHLPYIDIKDFTRVLKWTEGMTTVAGYKGDDLLYITEDELEIAIKCSAARCARVSYMKHDNTSPSIEDDIELYNMLVTRPYTDKRGAVFGDSDPIHASPCEHQGTPMPYVSADCDEDTDWFNVKGITHMSKDGAYWSGNIRGWIQARQLIQHG